MSFVVRAWAGLRRGGTGFVRSCASLRLERGGRRVWALWGLEVLGMMVQWCELGRWSGDVVGLVEKMGGRMRSYCRSREIPRIQVAVCSSCTFGVWTGVSPTRSLRFRVMPLVGLGHPAIVWAVYPCGLASCFASLPLDASCRFAGRLARLIRRADRPMYLYSFVPSTEKSWSYSHSRSLALHQLSEAIQLDLYAASRKMRLRPRARCRWIARLARRPWFFG